MSCTHRTAALFKSGERIPKVSWVTRTAMEVLSKHRTPTNPIAIPLLSRQPLRRPNFNHTLEPCPADLGTYRSPVEFEVDRAELAQVLLRVRPFSLIHSSVHSFIHSPQTLQYLINWHRQIKTHGPESEVKYEHLFTDYPSNLGLLQDEMKHN